MRPSTSKGFAKECAVVTHHRLEPDGEGGLQTGRQAGRAADRAADFSETIIGEMYSQVGSRAIAICR